MSNVVLTASHNDSSGKCRAEAVKKLPDGARQSICYSIGDCSLGVILIAATEKGICAILLGDDAEWLLPEIQQRFPAAQLIGANEKHSAWLTTVIDFIESPKHGLELPLEIRGTAFQQRVWQALREIPCGKTVSYSDIATKIGSPKSVRAVASACAANTIAVAIPCHRVVRINGDLSGYRWGIERKRELLAREKEVDVVAAGHARD